MNGLSLVVAIRIRHQPVDLPVKIIVRICIAAAWALLGTGCASYQPRPLSAGAGLADFDGRSLADSGLRDFLAKNHVAPRWDLKGLTMAAFYYHPSLAEARAQWEVAKAGAVTAGQRPNPSISFVPEYNTSAPPPWIWGLSFDIPIEIAGKRSKRLNQAASQIEAARNEIADAAWKVRSDVRTRTMELHAAENAAALLEKQVAVRNEIVTLLEKSAEAGEAERLEVTRERISRDQAKLQLRDAKRKEITARGQLAAAIGIPLAALTKTTLSLSQFDSPPPDRSPGGLRKQAAVNRTDIRSALASFAAADAALQTEIANQYPDIHLGTGYQLDQKENKWALGSNLTLPVFNRNRGPIADAEAKREAAAAKFQAVQTKALGEIDLAAAEYAAVRQKVGEAESLEKEAAKGVEQVKKMHEAGAVVKQDTLTAELERSVAEMTRLDALAELHQAAGKLEDALQSPLQITDSMLKIDASPAPQKKGKVGKK